MKMKVRSDLSEPIDRVFITILWIFLLINVASLIFYQFSNMRSDFFHESAYPYLYAQSDLDSKSIFNSQFSGREIAPISWTLVAHFLLLAGLKLTFLTVAISNLIFLAFSIAVIAWFGSVFGLKRMQILLLLVLFTTIYGVRPFKYSWMDQVWIWPMNSYGIYEIFSLLLCICSYKMLTNHIKEFSHSKFFTQNKFYLIPFFLFGLNHNRGLFEIYGPVGFSLLVLFFVSSQEENTYNLRRYLQVFLQTFFVTMAGRFLIGTLTSGVPQYWQQQSQNFTTLDQSNFISKLASPILTIFQVFGVNPVNGQPVVSLHGIKILSIFALVFIIVFVPIARYLRERHFNSLSLAGKLMFLHLVYFVLVAFLTSLFTNTAGVVRYLIPLAISSLFFAPFVFSENIKKQTLFTAIILVILVPNTFMGAKLLNERLDVTYRQNSNYLLTQSLLDRNLNYGYAGPWTEDVLVIPFYSNGKVHVSLIDVTPVAPHLHANKSWFRESSHSGETFVAIPTDLIATEKSLQRLVLASGSRYEVSKWTVLIFDDNPTDLIGQLD